MSSWRTIERQWLDFLRERSFDPRSPRVPFAWDLFQVFTEEMLALEQIGGLSVELLHVCDRDEDLWLSFGWALQGSDGSQSRVGAEFVRPVEEEFWCINEGFHHFPENVSTRDELLEVFEWANASKQFSQAFALNGWKWCGERW